MSTLVKFLIIPQLIWTLKFRIRNFFAIASLSIFKQKMNLSVSQKKLDSERKQIIFEIIKGEPVLKKFYSTKS